MLSKRTHPSEIACKMQLGTGSLEATLRENSGEEPRDCPTAVMLNFDLAKCKLALAESSCFHHALGFIQTKYLPMWTRGRHRTHFIHFFWNTCAATLSRTSPAETSRPRSSRSRDLGKECLGIPSSIPQRHSVCSCCGVTFFKPLTGNLKRLLQNGVIPYFVCIIRTLKTVKSSPLTFDCFLLTCGEVTDGKRTLPWATLQKSETIHRIQKPLMNWTRT